MSEKRRWQRTAPSGSVPRVGKIFVGPKSPMIDCRVIDLSAGGACLELRTYHDLPKKFEFIHGSTRRPCYLAWHRGCLVGVSYEESYQTAGNSSGLSRSTTSASFLSRPSASPSPRARAWPMSACATSQTIQWRPHLSAIGGKADLGTTSPLSRGRADGAPHHNSLTATPSNTSAMRARVARLVPSGSASSAKKPCATIS